MLGDFSECISCSLWGLLLSPCNHPHSLGRKLKGKVKHCNNNDDDGDNICSFSYVSVVKEPKSQDSSLLLFGLVRHTKLVCLLWEVRRNLNIKMEEHLLKGNFSKSESLAFTLTKNSLFEILIRCAHRIGTTHFPFSLWWFCIRCSNFAASRSKNANAMSFLP